MIDTSIFPYKNLPIRLEFGEKKSVTVCYFDCDYHLQKYIDRYKLDRKNIAISCRDENKRRLCLFETMQQREQDQNMEKFELYYMRTEDVRSIELENDRIKREIINRKYELEKRAIAEREYEKERLIKQN